MQCVRIIVWWVYEMNYVIGYWVIGYTDVLALNITLYLLALTFTIQSKGLSRSKYYPKLGGRWKLFFATSKLSTNDPQTIEMILAISVMKRSNLSQLSRLDHKSSNKTALFYRPAIALISRCTRCPDRQWDCPCCWCFMILT